MASSRELQRQGRSRAWSGRLTLVVPGVLLALGAAAWGAYIASAPERALDAHAALRVSVQSLSGTRGTADDAPMEVSVHVQRADAAALIVRSPEGELLMPPLVLDRVAGDPTVRRAVLSRRALRLYGPRVAGTVLAGARDDLERLLAWLRTGPEETAQLALLDTKAKALGLDGAELTLSEASAHGPHADHHVEQLERMMQRGDPEQALAKLEALLPTVPATAAPHLHALASEAAFAFGRLALASKHATRGLTLLARQEVVTHARLLRALLAAQAAGGLAEGQSASREALRALAARRSDPMEAALDAQSDLRFALVHDRSHPEAPLVPESAGRLVEAASRVDPARLAPLSAMLCEAGRRLAQDARAATLFDAAERAAGRDAWLASQAYCAFSRGDIARARGAAGEAERHYLHALSLLGTRRLPREQREAWYSAALSAADRGDLHEAFVRARRAAEWVDVLLALETDLSAREALLVNAGAYYAHAVALGTRAHEDQAALVLSEVSKGRAAQALLRGVGEIEESAVGAWLREPLEPGSLAPNTLGALGAGLGERDAVIAYTLLRASTHPGFDLVIGVVTRAQIASTVVETPSTFRGDLDALQKAVAQNDTASARAIGERLYTSLLLPVASWLEGRDRIYLSPHLMLHALPWAALHDGKAWLVERMAFARVPPLVVQEQSRCNVAAGRRWLTVFDPAHPSLEPLPGLLALEHELTSRLSPARALRVEAATPDAVRTGLSDANALFYAGHASFDAVRPMRSALLLAPSPGNPDDRMEVVDLVDMKRCMDLVVLLGCETARVFGKAHTYSDETLGLSRAFLASGARHVVGSLWPVIDRDAEDFARALTAEPLSGDVMGDMQHAQACLASGQCPSRGVASWGGYVLDTRVPGRAAQPHLKDHPEIDGKKNRGSALLEQIPPHSSDGPLATSPAQRKKVP